MLGRQIADTEMSSLVSNAMFCLFFLHSLAVSALQYFRMRPKFGTA